MIFCKFCANLWGVYRRCAYVVVLEHMLTYHYVVLFGEGSVSEIGEDIWASGLCTSFKENTKPCLQLDTNHLNYATAHRRWCTVSPAPPWVWLFHKQIHANRDTASSPIINCRWRVNFGQICLPCCHTGRSLFVWQLDVTCSAYFHALECVWISWCGHVKTSDAQHLWLSDDLQKLITHLNK